MRKKIVISLILASAGMIGCATNTHYRNINPIRSNQATFDQDSSLCRAIAVGYISMPNAPQYQNNVSLYALASGSMRDQYGNTYHYQERYSPMVAPNSMAMAQQSFNNMGATLHNISAQSDANAARNAIFNHCMLQHGWQQVSNEEIEANSATKAEALSNTVKSLNKSADQGNATAQYVLGLMYLDGRDVPQDNRKAEQWLQKAAAQGLAPAQDALNAMKRI